MRLPIRTITCLACLLAIPLALGAAPTDTPTDPATDTPTPALTPTHPPHPQDTPSESPTPPDSPTATQTSTNSNTPTPSPTATSTPSSTPTGSFSVSPTPTRTPTATPTPGPCTISTLAGGQGPGYSGDGGPAIAAQLNHPYFTLADQPGNLIFTDQGNNVLRYVFASSRDVTTVAGAGPSQGDGGPASLAQFISPAGMAVLNNRLYVADQGRNEIRAIDLSGNVLGNITRVAGTLTPGYSGDGGPAFLAQVNAPDSLAADGAGNLYFTDQGNNAIRRIDAAGNITTLAGGNTLAGYAGDGGPAFFARLSSPSALVLSCSREIYFSDTGNNAVRFIDATGKISTLAGNTLAGYAGDGGPATAALLSGPRGLLLDGLGDVLIADSGNSVIREILSGSGKIITAVGNTPPGYSGDGGPATLARLNQPVGLSQDQQGRLFIAEAGNNALRAVATPCFFPMACAPAPTATPSPRPTPSGPPPFQLHLYPNSPNPFTSSGTYLAYFVSEKASVEMAVYTVSGEKIRTFAAQNVAAGDHEQFWDARNNAGVQAASGVYLYRIQVTSAQGEVLSDVSKCALIR